MAPLRFFVVHNRLTAPIGHAFTESLGWRRVCQQRGIALDLLASRLATPQVLADTGARPVFGYTDEMVARFMSPEDAVTPMPPELAPLHEFMLTSFEAAQGCRTAWAEAAEKPDVMFFPWAAAGLLNGVADWLGDVEPAARPALVFNVVRPEPSWRLDQERRQASGDFTWFYFACRRLRSLAPAGRLVFTAVEPRLARLAAEAGNVDCRPGPLHNFYPTPSELDALRPPDRSSGVAIASVGSSHTEEKGWRLLPEIVARVCAARADASFYLQVKDRMHGERFSEALHASGAPVRVTLQPGPLSTEEYFRRIMLSDLVLLPYDSPAYGLMPSGVFADAVVCGTPVIAPERTWISDRLAEGWGAGVTFASAEAASIAEATVSAVDRVSELRTKAADQGAAWRRAHSLEAYLDAVMERLGLQA